MLDDVVAVVRSHARISEYAATEVRVRRARHANGSVATTDELAVHIALHVDHANGRGSATAVVLPHQRGEIRAIVTAALQHAMRAREPLWALPAPAAPARVDVFDPAAGDDVSKAAFAVERSIERALDANGAVADAAGETLRASLAVDVARTDTRVETSAGFRGEFAATLARVSGTLAPIGRVDQPMTARVDLSRRRLEELAIDDQLLAAGRRLRSRRRAGAPEPGRYDVALAAGALRPRDTGFGWFEPIVAQADGETARLGLSRYLPGQPLFGGGAAGDPLTIRSDGTLPFAPLSQPFGDCGAPVRRFALIDRGVAAGLALDVREAALLGEQPNGGVRNLVVDPGSQRDEQLREAGGRPLLRVRRLASLDIEPRTGAFAAEIAAATIGRDPIRGGVLRGNVFESSGTSRMSKEVADEGWYLGPAWLRLYDVELV